MEKNGIEAVKARISIVDVVRRYVDLKPVSGRWMGACPFHQETKPSMSVNDEEGFFYCFGCQASGDVIDFYMRINGLEFREALEQLAAEAGIELGYSAPDPHAAERKARKKLMLDIHDEACAWFKRNLRMETGRIARDYLSRRGIAAEVIDKFGLGYSPDDWHGLDRHFRSKGISQEDSVLAGMLVKNEKGNIYDRFRSRLIFPIQNLSSKVIAFGGRIISEGEPKYLNSSDTPIYKKGDHLYGLNLARPSMTRTRRAILTEGYMDVISLHQFGYTDACGVLGTALTPDQVKRLAGFCSRVDLVFDGDNAGRKAALKSSRMILLQGVACRVLLMPDGEDVDSLLQTHGRDGFEQCAETAPDGLDFCLSTLREKFSPREIMDWAKGFLKDLGDSSLRAYYLPRIANGLGLNEAELRQNAGGAWSAQTTRAKKKPENNEAAQTRPVGKDDKDDKYFISFPIQYPDYIRDLDKKGFERILATNWAKALWEKLKTQQPGADILSRLNDNEKRFYIRCRERLRENMLSGKQLLDEWEHICNKIASGQQRLNRWQLKEALLQAQQAGDSQRIMQCLRALNESLGRDDEQH
ncbi:DNA primase [Pseudodesulfovibrio tunisiensis]|uniref:DNA primase n=1 Tax=Pseudodesulfovibrio tunisiensis TaxID=463192 RepID=UPI001FB1D28B|nr:DNA primase [Pseudodesulfovibrio tunisiensis]